MRLAVTGTPGTGKTTAVESVDADLEVVHLNEVIREEGLSEGVDEDRDSVIADLDAVRDWLGDREDLLIESHLAHNLDVDRVVVLRCHPEELERRLVERGEAEAGENAETEEPSQAPTHEAPENAETTESSRALAHKARENAESEALDVVLSEAVARHGTDAVYEIDTTDRDPAEVAAAVEAVVAGEREPTAGEVSYHDYL